MRPPPRLRIWLTTALLSLGREITFYRSDSEVGCLPPGRVRREGCFLNRNCKRTVLRTPLDAKSWKTRIEQAPFHGLSGYRVRTSSVYGVPRLPFIQTTTRNSTLQCCVCTPQTSTTAMPSPSNESDVQIPQPQSLDINRPASLGSDAGVRTISSYIRPSGLGLYLCRRAGSNLIFIYGL